MNYIGPFIIISIFIILFITIIVIAITDETDNKKYKKILGALGPGTEILPISKKEAIRLLRRYEKLDSKKSLKKGYHYFFYRGSIKNSLKQTANLRSFAILVARNFNAADEFINKHINESSRVLIFPEHENDPKNLIVRHVWITGDPKGGKDLLVRLYDREDFKQFYENNKEYLKHFNEINNDFLRQLEVMNAISKRYIYVTTEKEVSEKMTLVLHDALDGYQVVSSINLD